MTSPAPHVGTPRLHGADSDPGASSPPGARVAPSSWRDERRLDLMHDESRGFLDTEDER